ncbi:mannose-1-phosphate guanylyltransferase/mannose-6-phosphate isomerase [Pelagibius sp.]|uniref:mannose-1-phosphate guanylyltransferase/mannose-6-phosphate isomerase n=1 Tax=Pelagibius sp. TaxID=1931238 RepID=UPI00262EB8BD|nr:mannose-1-phosphate guanylyltransferase/mannose-6-phosphate isomerase [Pelagibius sp.]
MRYAARPNPQDSRRLAGVTGGVPVIASKLHPVVLSGGSGERLWPLSRPQHPKQLLSLISERSMLQETVERIAGLDGCAPPLVVASAEHRFLVADQLQQLGLTSKRIVLEPCGRNTAPAAAVAALVLTAEDPEAVMVLMPADHAVRDRAAFLSALELAREAVAEGFVTFGIRPTRAETGYGYIKRGPALSEAPGLFRVESFVEKPDLATAETYLASGQYLWNSGIFVFSAARYLKELARQRPDILQACRKALEAGTRDQDFIRLDAAVFDTCPSESIDYAVMEKAARVVVIPSDMGWSDVGAWNALWEIAEKDDAANAVLGNCLIQDVQGSYLRSEDGRLVAAIGLADMVVISTKDAVLVAPRSSTMAVRDVVRKLKATETQRKSSA